MRETLASFGDAITWVREHWSARELPLVLHERTTDHQGDLGSPRYSAAFLGYLMARPTDTTTAPRSETCYHPRLARDKRGEIVTLLRDCPDCAGATVREVMRERWRWPMWLALEGLRKVPAMRPHQPSPYDCVLVLAMVDWDGSAAMRLLGLPGWDMAEALFIIALRKLHSRYSDGPLPRTSWTAKSESQQMAEGAAA